MKSLIPFVEAIYSGIFRDAYAEWPELGDSLRMDETYLRRALKERGLGFACATLPAYLKHFDRCLDDGILSKPEDMEPIRGIPFSGERPKLFGKLIDKVFDPEGRLWDEVRLDYTAILFLRTFYSAVKKFRVAYRPAQLGATLDEFYQIEKDLPPSWSNTWDSDIPEWQERLGHPLWGRGVDQMPDQGNLFHPGRTPNMGLRWGDYHFLCGYISSLIGEPDWWQLIPRHGPGAVSESGKEFVTKYEPPHWPRKLGNWFPYDWFGSGILTDTGPDSDREPPSRLIAVPKTFTGPRLICAEPIAHQWMQQGIWRWLEGRVRSTFLGKSIDFRNQEHSRRGALRGSLDGSLATIDLSSASDRISTRLVEYVFQGSPLLDGMHACRSRALKQTISPQHDELIVLRKFAPMGSALTFPVQSIVFLSLAIHAMVLERGAHVPIKDLPRFWVECAGQITVFGDDIVIPTDCVSRAIELLTECGLKVNKAKTFAGSHFRESCGLDAVNGVDVTPPRLPREYDGSPTSVGAMIMLSNNFHQKGFWRTAEVIASQLSPAQRKLLPILPPEGKEREGQGGGLGLESFCGENLSHLKLRWDGSLQRNFSYVLNVDTKVDKVRGTGNSGLTQYFTERPDPLHEWSSGQPRVSRARIARGRVYR